MAEISGTSSKYFYVNLSSIGIVSEANSGDDRYSTIGSVDTLKIYDKFQQNDLVAATDAPSMINARYHVAIAYKVLEMIDQKRSKMWEAKYRRMVTAIRQSQNPVKTKLRIRQHDF